MGRGLRELVEAYRSQEFSLTELKHSHLAPDVQTGRRKLVHNARVHMIVDEQNRVMVRVVLDGTLSMPQLRQSLRGVGATVVADDTVHGRAADVYIPLDQAETIARMPGVAAVNLLRSPIFNAGSITTEGASVMHADQVNGNGVTGKGITIGILSDSFNLNGVIPAIFLQPPVIAALDDVNSGDLPMIGVAEGRPGLKFLIEGSEQLGGADEGRALAQIAYDMAPSSSLCFAPAAVGEFSFAANIRRLRTDPQCAADIMVDDVTYLDEPAFSDGIVAQAVNDVATSSALAGKPVAFFSSAGNNGGAAYSSDLHIVADADARAMSNLPIDLTTIPASVDTSGGFHNFNPDLKGTPILSQSVTISQSAFYAIVLQWDDPFFVVGGITTDLNLLAFDSSGKYLTSFSSTDNNFQTLVPLEGFENPNGGNFNARLVIARTGKGAHSATKVFLLELVEGGLLTGDYLDATAPAIFGHATAKGAIAVGAYTVDNGINAGQFTPELESYSSPGPAIITLDSSGNRLGSPEIRQKPEVAGVDNVSNTFFGNPDFGDPFFSFAGTSAAAPHVAGVAALLLENAGGPGSLTPDQIRSKLIASTGTHDLDPFYSQAVLGDNSTVIKLSARGGDNQGFFFGSSTLTDPKFFNLQFTSPTAGQTLSSLQIDLSPTGLFFNINARTGFPMKIGASSDGVQATSSVSGTGSTIATVNFTGLNAGGFVQFGIGRTQRSTRSNGYSADLLAGAKVTVTLANPAATFTGTLANQTGTGFASVDGWGLVDAVKALQAK